MWCKSILGVCEKSMVNYKHRCDLNKISAERLSTGFQKEKFESYVQFIRSRSKTIFKFNSN